MEKPSVLTSCRKHLPG